MLGRGGGRSRARGRGEWRGRGRGRGIRGGDSGHGNDNRGVCYSFQKTGRCVRGAACQFGHDRNGQSQTRRAVRSEKNEEQQETRRSYNAWKRLLSDPPSNPLTMRRVWEGALRLLDEGDQDWTQQLPRDLDNDDDDHRGRVHIKAILDSNAVGGNRDDFLSNARNFLMTLTHQSLIHCLAVDTYVGSLYNFFGGVDGKRAVSFLQRCCMVSQASKSAGGLWDSQDSEALLQAMSLALFELLKRECRVRFNEDISTLVDSMETANTALRGEVPLTSIVRITKRIADVRAALARAQELLADPASGDGSDVFGDCIASSYPRDIVVPSNRHDNDKRDIVDIIIFPTRDEIMSDAEEFLPFTDPNRPHFLDDPVQRHIDTYFRLGRHDTFGNLKEDLATIMHAAARDPKILSNPKLNFGGARTYQYGNASVRYVTITSRKGLQAQIAFPQPSLIRGVSKAEKQKWWEESRRFEEGSLLSLLWVQDSGVQHVFLSVSDKITDPTKEHGLADDKHMACITVSLVTQDLYNFRNFMQANATRARCVLLEFPKIIPATFVPILESLKAMQRLNNLPFREWIIPTTITMPLQSKKVLDIPPPLYARTAGFTFPLRALSKDEDKSFSLSPTSSCNDETLIDMLEARTELDRGQCRALIAALTREFSFIQGPPGTGKSYLGLQIMKVLLDIRLKAHIGPILIVCYTNHALDQFLEHLVDIGVRKVLRVGGQSKSPKLADHNLRSISKSESKTKNERYMIARSYETLEKNEGEAKSAFINLRGLQKNANWQALKLHIRDGYPRIYSQFEQVDAAGFKAVGRHPFDIWSPAGGSSQYQAPVGSVILLPPILNKANNDVFSLDGNERGILLAHWVAQAQRDKVGELFEIVSDATKAHRHLSNIHDESDRRILQNADVIGVTTSGLAKRISVLKHVKCKVLICEEAGEVMEPHMLSALLPDIEHCIQIGDHEQLRPTVNNFRDLSLESERGKLHALDRSQFERLSMSQPGRPTMPVAQLNVQRRMCPQVSTLIRETIYEKLIDHHSTADLPDVVGMRNNVFWLNHNNMENEKDMNAQHTKSKSNAWEVEMIHALVRHVVRQGIYKTEDIAVLTPYTGQLQILRATMRKSFEIVLSDRDQEALEKDGFGLEDLAQAKDETFEHQDHRRKPLQKKNIGELLRLATVDNFQGEEAKIVIVSLVRSNEKRNVGFLKTTNRINVLLSRAQHGMYLIGNAKTYSNVEMWQKVINMLCAADSLGDSLALCCPRHPQTTIEVQQPDDFLKFSPEGGCREACTDRLDCGHRCQARCHSTAMHEVFVCEQPCQRRHQPCEHICQKPTCGQSCGKCMIKLDNVQLPCGHTKNDVACHLTLDLSKIYCKASVLKKVPNCGHNVAVMCSQDVTKEDFKCPTPCSTSLSCSHSCPGSCSRCKTKGEDGLLIVKHISCSKTCGRKSGTCNHNCPRKCHDGTDCGLCQQPCEVRCKHNKCPQKCHDPCAPCIEPCVWSCEHQGQCTMPCSGPCNRLPCDERCSKLLPCDHQCPSLCGEVCPIDCCQECGMKPDEQPDMIMMTPYADLDLNESPIVVLGCGHFFTIETLDGLVGLKDVYQVDPKTGSFTALYENTRLAASVPQCPNCRCPIKQYVTQRYNRLINRAVIDEMSKRFIVSGQQELRQLEKQLHNIEGSLTKSRKSLVPDPTVRVHEKIGSRFVSEVSRTISSRYGEVGQLVAKVKSLMHRMATQHQPAHKLHEAIVHSKTRKDSLNAALAALTIDNSTSTTKRDSDQRVVFGARLLEIKIQCLLLEDKFGVAISVASKAPSHTVPLEFWGGHPTKKSEPFLQSCTKLINDCTTESLPKLAVEATLYYSRIAQLFGSSTLITNAQREKAKAYRQTAKDLLTQAEQLCKKSFRDRDTLLEAIVHALKMLGREFYEPVSQEEIDQIKRAMVSGYGGMATHSGHWYDCENGHPFAIGECGMPMEQARCPECGASVGGQNHTAVDGVTRATRME